MATRTTRKAAAPKPAPATEPTVEPTVDDVINEGEPMVDIVEEEPADEPAVPATSQLDPPPAPAASNPNGLGLPSPSATTSAQVTPEVADAGWGEPRREYIDAATRERVTIEDAFEKVAARGGAYICRVRIVERIWSGDRSEPNSRLVLAAGSRVDAGTVEHLTNHITASHAEWAA